MASSDATSALTSLTCQRIALQSLYSLTLWRRLRRCTAALNPTPWRQLLRSSRSALCLAGLWFLPSLPCRCRSELSADSDRWWVGLLAAASAPMLWTNMTKSGSPATESIILLEVFFYPPEPFIVSNPSGFAAWIHNGLRYHEVDFCVLPCSFSARWRQGKVLSHMDLHLKLRNSTKNMCCITQ